MPRALVRARALFAIGASALAIGGCVTAPPPPSPPSPPPPVAPLPARYAPTAWNALPGWSADRVQDAWPAFVVGCTALVAKASTQPLWQRVCDAGRDVDARDERAVRTFFEQNFTAYQVSGSDGSDSGLVTGYYEPLLTGSRTPSARYRVPLYSRPDDLLTVELGSLHAELNGKRVRGRLDGTRVVPYWSRAEIESGRGPGSGKALAFVEDPVEAFFLEIQGSGRVKLPDGTVMRVGYADQNGHPYRSIGRVLIDRGTMTLAQASLAGIREWARRNPGELRALLDENPSYVFFREVPPFPAGTLEARIDGPIGSLGVPLLRERTLAVDPRSIPLGAPVFLATTFPLSEQPLARLMLAQDTGGAIRGAVRADFFWGFGDEAGRAAGRMRQQGRMWLLWPKDAPMIGEK